MSHSRYKLLLPRRSESRATLSAAAEARAAALPNLYSVGMGNDWGGRSDLGRHDSCDWEGRWGLANRDKWAGPV